jgi:hypothetical protein
MARKTKYFFNPKSLSFERVTDNRSYMLWRGIGFSSLILVISFILAVFFGRIFANPRERSLMDENSLIKQELKVMERSVTELEKSLADLCTRQIRPNRLITAVLIMQN